MQDRYAPYHSACNGPRCRQQVLWVRTLGGAIMPLDPDKRPDGNVVLVTGPNGIRRARVLTGDELPALRPCYIPHHRTCIDSADYRRRQAATAPKCPACREPMAAALVEMGERYHVNCAPPSTFLPLDGDA